MGIPQITLIMALVVSLLASYAAFSAAVTISVDSEEVPVRRQAAKAKDEPLSLEQKEEMSLSKLHQYWPSCQAQEERNWNTATPGQHMKKMHVVPNVTSAQACGDMCGTYTYKHGDVDIPCATWSWVSKSWATEFHGFQSCAMFGFMQNADAGVARAPVSELAFKSHCCVAGTPCVGGAKITPYEISADRVAAAYRKAERARHGREKMERMTAATKG